MAGAAHDNVDLLVSEPVLEHYRELQFVGQVARSELDRPAFSYLAPPDEAP